MERQREREGHGRSEGAAEKPRGAKAAIAGQAGGGRAAFEDTLTLDLQPPHYEREISHHLSHSVCRTSLWQPWRTNADLI